LNVYKEYLVAIEVKCLCFSSNLLSKNINIRIYKTIILPVVLYGCKTWSLTLREKQGLSPFENRVLMRISRRNRVTGDWGKLNSEGLHNLYSSPRIVRVVKAKEDEISRSCSMMDLGETRCGCMDWIDFAQDRGQWRAFGNMVIKPLGPQNTGGLAAEQLAAS
jgi:hypothetical protein